MKITEKDQLNLESIQAYTNNIITILTNRDGTGLEKEIFHEIIFIMCNENNYGKNNDDDRLIKILEKLSITINKILY